jgi:hypothetical protein
MSKFALLAQATRLLGQVLDLITRRNSNWASREEDSIQLDRTLHALIKAAEAVRPVDCDAMGICYRYYIHDHRQRQ